MDVSAGMSAPPTQIRNVIRRWLPVTILVMLIALAYALGLHRQISLAAIVENREALHGFVEDRLVLAILIYMVIYIAVVALSVPGAAVLSITGGFLFGWTISVPVAVLSAVIGSIIVFQIVKTSLGATLAERAGPLVKKVSDGFAADAFSYLLFLRLVPAFPFFMVNAVAGLCRVSQRTFIIATAIGIIPGAIAFALLGSGLDGVIDAQTAAYQACVAENGAENCSFDLNVSSLVTNELLFAFAGLGVIALLPLVLKRWRRVKP